MRRKKTTATGPSLAMSARLASFRGPSTPSSSPVKRQQQQQQQVQSPPNKPTQAAKSPESTYHRKLRASLQELRTACRTWDNLVRKDGLRAIRELIDARTDLECVVCRSHLLLLWLLYSRNRWIVVVICSLLCLRESSRAHASSVQSSNTWTSVSRRSTWSYQSLCVVVFSDLIPASDTICRRENNFKR